MHSNKAAVIIGLGIVAALSSVIPASAAGCNGVVNQLVWGCAAWDNNNGPQFPNYRAPARAAVPAPSMTTRTAPIMSNAGGGFIGNNGSAFVGNNGSAIIGQDGAG